MNEVQIAIIVVSAIFVLVAYLSPTTSQFYLGSASYGPLVSAMSIVAAFTGGGALLNTTGLASKYGFWAFFDVVPAVGGLIVSAIFVAMGFFGKRFSSLFFDINSESYDLKAVTIHYLQVAFLYTLVIAAQLRAVATAADAMGTPVAVAVIFCCLVVGIYAYRGFDAVTKTDVVQFILMLPLYLILAFIAFEPSQPTSVLNSVASTEMPTSLALALCLPLLFLPISQEIHQRGASAESNQAIGASYVIAGIFYAVMGTLLVVAFTKNPSLSISSLIAGPNRFAAVIAAIAFFAAILSTLDTSTNLASHAVQKLHPFRTAHPALVQAVLLLVGCLIFLYFKTVLALILFALFLYMAGPAFTFVAVYAGVHPRRAAAVGVTFCALQSVVHFRLASYPGLADLLKAASLDDPLRAAIYLLIAQLLALAALLAHRRLA